MIQFNSLLIFGIILVGSHLILRALVYLREESDSSPYLLNGGLSVVTKRRGFEWKDKAIRHVLTVESRKGGTRLRFKIVKDGGVQDLPPINLPEQVQDVTVHWTGEFVPVTQATSETFLYVQGRVLLQLPTGCVYWSVNHWVGKDDKKHSIDTWCFLPGMCVRDGHLEPI